MLAGNTTNIYLSIYGQKGPVLCFCFVERQKTHLKMFCVVLTVNEFNAITHKHGILIYSYDTTFLINSRSVGYHCLSVPSFFNFFIERMLKLFSVLVLTTDA